MKDFLDALSKIDPKLIASLGAIIIPIAAAIWAAIYFLHKERLKNLKESVKNLETSLTICRNDQGAKVRDAVRERDTEYAKVVVSLKGTIEELNKKQARLEIQLKESHALKEKIWWDLKELRSLAGDPVREHEALIEKWRELKTKYPDIQEPPDPQLRITRGSRAPSGPEKL